MDITIRWRPQPRQLTFLTACGLDHPFRGGGPRKPKARVIGYGGAAGGGKSDSLLVAGVIAGLTFPGINIGYFRRKYTQLEGPGGAIMRSQELLSGFAKWHGGRRRWTLPTGAILQFCYCDAESDVYNYQSQQFDIILIDEATQFTRFQYRYLMTRNRATREGVVPFMALATNPGNIGHQWFRSEFIDIGPFEEPHEVEVEPGRIETHMFIPAKLSDNKILEKRDPAYRKALEAQPELIRKQLLDGDWNAFEGQYYPEWRRDIHVVKPFDIPRWWKKFCSLDYGLDCTACYWWAVDQQGKLYIYRELWQPNLNLSDAVEKIREMTPPQERDEILYTVASPDLWNRQQDTGISGYEIMMNTAHSLHFNLNLMKADDRRIPGWRALREYLAPYKDEFGKTTAHLKVFDHCIHLIRDMPALLHDEHNPEDAADEPHEITHGPDSIRYGIMSRPPLRSITEEEKKYIRKERERRTRPLSRATGY